MRLTRLHNLINEADVDIRKLERDIEKGDKAAIPKYIRALDKIGRFAPSRDSTSKGNIGKSVEKIRSTVSLKAALMECQCHLPDYPQDPRYPHTPLEPDPDVVPHIELNSYQPVTADQAAVLCANKLLSIRIDTIIGLGPTAYSKSNNFLMPDEHDEWNYTDDGLVSGFCTVQGIPNQVSFGEFTDGKTNYASIWSEQNGKDVGIEWYRKFFTAVSKSLV